MTTVISDGQVMMADVRTSVEDENDSNVDKFNRVRTYVSDHAIKLVKTNIIVPEDMFKPFSGNIKAMGFCGYVRWCDHVRDFVDREKNPKLSLKTVKLMYKAYRLGGGDGSMIGITDQGKTLIFKFNDNVVDTAMYPAGTVVGIGSGYAAIASLEELLGVRLKEDLQEQFYMASVLDRNTSSAHHEYTVETDALSSVIRPSQKTISKATKSAMRYVTNNFNYHKEDLHAE